MAAASASRTKRAADRADDVKDDDPQERPMIRVELGLLHALARRAPAATAAAVRCCNPVKRIAPKIATPSADAICRWVLNSEDARPVSAGLIVANASACNGMNSNGRHSPRPNMMSRTHHRFVS